MRTAFVLALLIGLGAGPSVSPLAHARVGGGHSYSGGSHSSGGGRSSHSSGSSYSSPYSSSHSSSYSPSSRGSSLGGLVELVFWVFFRMIQLVYTRPLVGIPLNLAVFWALPTLWRRIQASAPSFDVDAAWKFNQTRRVRATLAQARLRELREKLDPAFSAIAFRDFCHALYSTVHHARGERKLDAYSGYLSEAAREALRKLNPSPAHPQAPVQGVVIGSCTVTDVGALASPDGPPAPLVRVTVEYEANFTETPSSGPAESWYSRETWTLARAAGAQSRPPERIRQIACPACGGPPRADAHGLCPQCGQTVRGGVHDWYVERISITRSPKPPLLESTVLEEGTDLPTLFDPALSAEIAQIAARFPDWNPEAFGRRAGLVFNKLQDAWTRRQWELVRPFETDALFESHSYWIAEYKRQRRVNVLQDAKVSRIEIVKADSDAYFASVTARIHASVIDFTQDESSRIVSGDPKRPRVFTEYWTFVRGRSPSPRKPGTDDLHCPGCGSELKIGMTGECQYCGAKVTTGDFDWVLSSIEQDEAYSG